jgi:hypothetical protein
VVHEGFVVLTGGLSLGDDEGGDDEGTWNGVDLCLDLDTRRCLDGFTRLLLSAEGRSWRSVDV